MEKYKEGSGVGGGRSPFSRMVEEGLFEKVAFLPKTSEEVSSVASQGRVVGFSEAVTQGVRAALWIQ